VSKNIQTSKGAVTSVKTSASPTQVTGMSTQGGYLVVVEEDKENAEDIVISKSKKNRGIIYYCNKLVDPEGKIVENLDDKRTFLLTGENLSASAKSKNTGGRGRSKNYINKPPKVGTKTFGNEGIPKMNVHTNPLKNYLFCQFIPPATLASSNTLDLIGNSSWTLGQLDGIGSFTGLFDEYCVRRAEVWFVPGLTEQTSANVVPTQLFTAYDMDGSVIVTQADIRQYETLVISAASEGQYVSFTPSVAVATYGGAFTKYSYLMNQWLDVANTDINLYGLAYVLGQSSTNGQFQYALDVRLWVEFRGVR
jgi:hypothetical protein